ncbi:MAG: aldo/keto reductase [Nitrospiraceae bacterium]
MPVTTYNGVTIPDFMYGTAWKKEATAGLVVQAVTVGFRAIDTANQLVHYDEALVGAALQALTQDGVTRDALFLQTKFTPVDGQDHRLPYDPRADVATQVRQSFESSCAHLHTTTLDSYVLHGPYGRRGLTTDDWSVWRTMEALYREGRTRMIGVSNVSAEQLALFCAQAEVKPMVVQNRCYAAFGWDRSVRTICKEQGVVYQGFSLLTANREVFVDPTVREMARRYGVGLAQLVFRFAMQVGMLPLTGTTNPQHMEDDLACTSITLTDEDVQYLDRIAE